MKRKLVTRLFASALVAALTVGCMAGCGGKDAKDNDADTNQGAGGETEQSPEGGDTAEPEGGQEEGTAEGALSGTITFATNRTDMDEGLAAIIAEFNKTYPDVTVEVEPIQDYVTAIKTRLGAGEAPDVMYVNGQIAPTKDLYPQFFLPLDDLGYTAEDIYFYDTGVYDGTVYNLCEGVNMTGFVCDITTLKNAGIEETPKTYDEFMDACEKLKAAGITPVGSMAMTKWPLSSWLTVATAGETDAEAFYNAMTESDTPFTADNGIGKMLSFVKDLSDKGYFDADPVSSDWDILRMDMSKTGFLYVANYALGALDGTEPENIAFFPLSIDNSGKQYTDMTPSWNIAVNKDCENPDAAKAFVKFWLEASTFQDDTGLAPSLKTRTSGLATVDAFMAHDLVVFEDVSTEAYNSISAAAQMGFIDLVQEVMLGKSVEEVCDTYNQKWAEARSAQ